MGHSIKMMKRLLFAAFVGACLAASPPRIPSSSVATAPPLFAVGFDLSEQHGTASVRLFDGSVRRTAYIKANDAYISEMLTAGKRSARHIAPPYQWKYDNNFADMPRQALRRARKAVGLPASYFVGVLSEMLTELRWETEDALVAIMQEQGLSMEADGVVIDRGILTAPEMPALYDEDLEDAAIHAGIELLQSKPFAGNWRNYHDPETNKNWTLDPWIQRPPRHPNAFFSAYGLASDLHHPVSPSLDPALEKYNALFVHVTREGASIAPIIKYTNRSCFQDWGQHPGWYNSSMGLTKRANPKGLWEMIHRAVADLRSPYNGPDRNITDVLFAGEGMDMPEAVDMVLDYIWDLEGQTIRPRVWPRATDAEEYRDYMINGASHGAAMMAWQQLAHEPLYGDTMECFYENQRNTDHWWEIKHPPPDDKDVEGILRFQNVDGDDWVEL